MTHFVTKTFSKGEFIIKEGEIGEEAFIINSGNVEIIKYTVNKKAVGIATLGPGDLFGEMSLFDEEKRSASAIAINEVEIRIIHKQDFVRQLQNTPPEIRYILELILERLRKTSALISKIKVESNKYYV